MSGFLFDRSPTLDATHNLSVSDDCDSDAFASPLIEASEPLLSDHSAISSSDKRTQSVDEGTGDQPTDARLNVPQWCSKRLSSDLKLMASSLYRGSSNLADSRRTAFHVGANGTNTSLQSETKKPQTIPAFVFPASKQARRPLQRSTSSPGPETNKSQYNDLTTDSATLQKRLMTQTKHTGRAPVRPWRVRRVRTASAPFQWTNPQSPGRPGFMWFSVRSNSDPSSIPQVAKPAEIASKSLPLKPCMKHKSKSAATTPPNERHGTSGNPSELQKLRRIKTVDFEDGVSRKLLSLPPLKVWTGEASQVASNNLERSKARGTTGGVKPAKFVSGMLSCPGPMTKSVPADTAVTRTDVHVVAIAPSWSIDDVPDEGGIDPATPTMQIVESNSGCYEVVWDDVPLEHDIRLHQRRSSASQALYTASPEASRGLERINTKLTEWSFGKENPAELFKPQIVVFPEDYSLAPRFDCAVEDEEDFIIIAPPNSERTSANPSRRHSRPGSIHRSRSESYTDDEAELTLDEADVPEKRELKHNSLVVPDPKAHTKRPGYLIGASGRIRKPPSFRRLSNMDETDLKFRGHRDSVALARSRILNAGGVSPDLFMHRDSVSLAKRRMHTRNHAISSAREIPLPKVRASDPSTPADDLDQSSPSLPAKSAPTKALKSSNSASMLLPQPANTNRHIRIMEIWVEGVQ
ncbi:hypothetical protein K505DRAFT_370591 [Melanomma pulvis-pyrius CBS 109.77]|uniref:Uncharacterized protein n=1 Tax=Melanomma pulvis-pyrius CBS 109.77 TaxID=1314802 RepID=A0A6A6XW04_9PLEO|nr:hypothetical protein K505DRAFT_370591 [Melanomma pulvis-pyrius CBS 109.77]